MSDAHFDVLVLGGGMAGMAAATQAAQRGARVMVCEVADELGGTALLSTGNVWTVQTPEAFLQADPEGDVALWQVVRDEMEEALAWVESLDVPVRERHRSSSSSTYDPPPIGRNVDIETFVARGRRLVEAAGGVVLHGTTVSNIKVGANGVAGARVLTVATGDEHDVTVNAVVLASGGFQASAEHRAKYLGEVVAGSVAIRSNPNSKGVGLDLALAAGAVTSARTDTFYGVILPAVPGEVTEADYRGLVLHSAVYGVALGPDGNRLADESSGAVPLANAIARAGRAVLFFSPAMAQAADDTLGNDLALTLKAAEARGARVATAKSLESAADVLAGWAYDGPAARKTLLDFDGAVGSDAVPAVPRRRYRHALAGDLLMAEVQAAMTSTYGGVRTDGHGQALAADGAVVPGLYAAGIDQGGYNVAGYAGGLSRSLVFGRRAGLAASKRI